MGSNFLDIIEAFKETCVLVIGDVMMDAFIWGKVSRISPEAPVPVVEVKEESLKLGGAANVVHNIVSLGGKVLVAGVIGPDEMGRVLTSHLRRLNVHPAGLVVEKNRITTVKTRIIAHSQQVVRVDKEDRNTINGQSVSYVLEYVKNHLSKINAILISDYAKGVICKDLMDGIKSLLKDKKDIILAVDPKLKNIPLYREVSIVTPNHLEALQILGIDNASKDNIEETGKRLLSELKTHAILITRGPEGMTLFEKNCEAAHIPAMAKKVYDVTGAGDTVIATLILAWASGATLKKSAILANVAAGIVVGELGTVPVNRHTLIKMVKHYESA